MKLTKDELRTELANVFGCDEAEVVGSITDLLREAEVLGNVTVYWAAIPDELLKGRFEG